MKPHCHSRLHITDHCSNIMKNTFPVYNIAALSELKTEDFLVSRLDSYLEIHKELFTVHRHDFFHMVLFTEGSGFHQIDFQQFEVRPFQIYFMVPGQVHSWNFQCKIAGYVLNFSPSFFDAFLVNSNYINELPFFSGSVEDQVLHLEEGLRGPLCDLFENLISESQVAKTMGYDLVRVLLLDVFIRISRSVSTRNINKRLPYNDTLLRNFKQLIEQNYISLRLPKDYAALLYITPNHLNSLCHDVLGIAAGELIRNRVILEAKRLLANLDIPISEIAGKLNFTDNSNFSKFFKKQAGLAPEEFRKRALKTSYENN